MNKKEKDSKEERIKHSPKHNFKPKAIYLNIDLELSSSVDSRVSQLRESIGGFSKRQWITEAVQEKLISEAEKAKEKRLKFAEQN